MSLPHAKIVPVEGNGDLEKGDSPLPQAVAIGPRSEKYMQTVEEQAPGLLKNVADQCETPKQMLERVLMPGEIVLADFDCYFPYKSLPMWKILLYCLITGGLYALVLCYRSMQRWCYRMKCCTPQSIELARGKMAVTSKGRLICWELEAYQQKEKSSCLLNLLCCLCKCCCSDLLAAPANYSVTNVTQVYLASSIREIAHFYRSRAACCFCLCNDYATGVKVSLQQFDHSGKFQKSPIETFPNSSFISSMQESVGNAFEFTASAVESALNVSSGSSLYILSNTTDRVHLDDQASVLEDLALLSERFISVLPKINNIAYVPAETTRLEIVDQLNGLRIVYDDGTITVPTKWFKLMSGEEVVAVNGQVYTMNFKEWMKAICSLGYYYCAEVRSKKFLRTALVLTNKRVVAIDIYQRAGIIPHNFIDFTYQVTSYFPGKIKAGYFKAESKEYLEIGLSTEGGELKFTLFNRKDRSLKFAKALQTSTARVPADAINYIPVSSNVNVSSDLELLPMIPNEKVVDVIVGNTAFHPCCYSNSFPMSLCCSFCPFSLHLCSKQLCGGCFPCLPEMLTCALRPFRTSSNIIITDSTLYNVIREGNSGLCGFQFSADATPCFSGPCKTTSKFIVSWVPITDLKGHTLALYTSGKDTCMRRCCAKCGICGCGQCCPISNNEYELTIDVGGFTFGVSGAQKNHNYLADENLLKLNNNLSNLELGIHAVEMNR